MKSSTRMALNTTATYACSLMGVGLALFSSRWILQALGATDFGLFGVVGSILVFITFLNGLMSGSAARHFAYSIGQGDFVEVHKWFNASLSLHLVIPVVLIGIGWPIAEYAIRHWLTVPPERIHACVFVFRLSLISAFTGMLSVPFMAMLNAKQRLVELAGWNVVNSLLIFVLAWMLGRLVVDELTFYAAGMVGITLFFHLTLCSRALWLFPECRLTPALWFDFARFKELGQFAGWTFIGALGTILRNRGSNILLNVFFGPSINAAYGIANQVSNQTGRLSVAMLHSLSPEVTAREGRGERDRMIGLSMTASKLGTFFVMLFAIPFILETELILRLWLINPPQYAVELSRLMMITFLVDKLAVGYMLAIKARGQIAGYQATVGVSMLMTLPLAWGFLKLGGSPPTVGVAFVTTQVLCSIGRLLWGRKLMAIPINRWLVNVLGPLTVVAAIAILAIMLPHNLMGPGWARLLAVCFTGGVVLLVAGWMFVLSKEERKFLSCNVRNIFSKKRT